LYLFFLLLPRYLRTYRHTVVCVCVCVCVILAPLHVYTLYFVFDLCEDMLVLTNPTNTHLRTPPSPSVSSLLSPVICWWVVFVDNAKHLAFIQNLTASLRSHTSQARIQAAILLSSVLADKGRASFAFRHRRRRFFFSFSFCFCFVFCFFVFSLSSMLSLLISFK
jgi:hypothetical protein